MPRFFLILTCEHGGNHVPAAYRHLFKGHYDILRTHEGYDIGALSVARHLARRIAVPLFFADETRLLIDQNRSPGNPRLFSRFSRHLSEAQRTCLIRELYQPHHQRVVQAVKARVAGRIPLLHLAIHSFTPVLRGKTRNADIGILYDPASSAERSVAASLRAVLGAALPGVRIRCNYPYRGTSDGLTTALRSKFGTARYAGLEMEINQALLSVSRKRQRIGHTLAAAIRSVVTQR